MSVAVIFIFYRSDIIGSEVRARNSYNREARAKIKIDIHEKLISYNARHSGFVLHILF